MLLEVITTFMVSSRFLPYSHCRIFTTLPCGRYGSFQSHRICRAGGPDVSRVASRFGSPPPSPLPPAGGVLHGTGHAAGGVPAASEGGDRRHQCPAGRHPGGPLCVGPPPPSPQQSQNSKHIIQMNIRHCKPPGGNVRLYRPRQMVEQS